MKTKEIKKLIREIVEQAVDLKNKHTAENDAPVNYAAIFAQSQPEYNELLEVVKEFGSVIKETSTGPLFKINLIATPAGRLQLLKIRQPNKTRPERGDADFTLTDYPSFKKIYLNKPGFKLIERATMEMIELMDKDFKVRAYFSFPPLDQQLGL